MNRVNFFKIDMNGLSLQTRFANLSNGFSALRVRNYRLYWFGQLISVIGTWMQTTAQQWLVYQLTGSAFDLGLVTTLQFLPLMLFSLLGGVVADRLPKRNLMIVTQSLLLSQAVVFGLLVASGSVQIWHVYVLAAVQGFINVVDNPVRQSMPAELVERERVGNAVALNSMLFNAARILGPALAGIVIAAIGIAPALFINAISFLAVIAALILINSSQVYNPSLRPHHSMLRELADGIAFVRTRPALLTILLVIWILGTFGYNFSTIIPMLGGFVVHTDAAGFGALSTALGIGSFVGAILAAYSRDLSIKRLFVGAGLFSLFLGVLSLANTLPLSEVVLVALGLAGVVFTTTANTLLQKQSPDEMRGRVMSLYVLLFIGTTPIGAFITGSLASSIGVQPTLAVEASVCAAGLISAGLYYRFKGSRKASS